MVALLLFLFLLFLVLVVFFTVVAIAVELVLAEFDCNEERDGRLLFVVLIGGCVSNEEAGNDAAGANADDADDDGKWRSRLRR
jgi:hypothetical protein